MYNTHIKNHRALAIVSIFGSLIFGLIALNYSWQVDKALRDNDLALAAKHSRTASIWAWISIAIGVIFVLFHFYAAATTATPS